MSVQLPSWAESLLAEQRQLIQGQQQLIQALMVNADSNRQLACAVARLAAELADDDLPGQGAYLDGSPL